MHLCARDVRVRTGHKALEERLVAQVGVVLLEVLLGRSHELDGDELEAERLSALTAQSVGLDRVAVPTLLETADDLANEATLRENGVSSGRSRRRMDA